MNSPVLSFRLDPVTEQRLDFVSRQMGIKRPDYVRRVLGLALSNALIGLAKDEAAKAGRDVVVPDFTVELEGAHMVTRTGPDPDLVPVAPAQAA